MASEGVRVPGWWTHSRWVHTERLMQLFRHSLKHGICLWASKWRVITALILIFIQVLSSQLSRSSWPNLKNESWSRRVERGSLFKYKVSWSHIQGRNIYTCSLGGGANHSASPWLCLLSFVCLCYLVMNHKDGDYGAHIQTISLRSLWFSLSCTHKKRLCDGWKESSSEKFKPCPISHLCTLYAVSPYAKQQSV